MENLENDIVYLRMNFEDQEHEESLYLEGICEILVTETGGKSFEVMEKVIGYIEFSMYYPIQQIVDCENLLDETYLECGDKYKLIKDFLLYLANNNKLSGFSFLTIDRMNIDSEYRNRYFGSNALKQFIERGTKAVDYLIVRPAPIEPLKLSETRIIKIKEIAKFYERLGFTSYQSNFMEKNEPIMIYGESCSMHDLFATEKLEINPNYEEDYSLPTPIITPEIETLLDDIFKSLFKS